MAEETLVKEPLTREMVESGEALLKLLLEANLDLGAAFWQYTSETNQWSLVFSFPQIDRDGPLKAYETVQRLIRGPEGLSQMPTGFHKVAFFFPRLSDIVILSPSNPLVIGIRNTLDGWPFQTHEIGIRLTSTRVGDAFVEDSLVYRLPNR